MNIDLIKNTTLNAEFNPADYEEDIEYVKLKSEYKWEVAQSRFLECKVAFDNAKTTQPNTKFRWDRASQNS